MAPLDTHGSVWIWLLALASPLGEAGDARMAWFSALQRASPDGYVERGEAPLDR